VTIAGAPFPHLLFEFVLSFSGWRWVCLASGETYEALMDGIQGALWALGGTPDVIRSDNLSAATHELKRSGGRALTERFANFLGYFYAERNQKLKEAETLVKKALKKEPDNAAFLDSLGWVYYKQATVLGQKGRLNDALSYLKRAAAKGQDPVIQEHLGDVYLASGQQKKALQAYRRALEKYTEDRDKSGVEKKIRLLEEQLGK